MREQELRVRDDAREPALLQMARREVAQQHGDFPHLHQLVGESESPRAISSAMMAKVATSVALSSSTPPNSSGTPSVRMPTLSAPARIRRQARFRHHAPFALPVAADERDHHVVDEIAAAFAASAVALRTGRARSSPSPFHRNRHPLSPAPPADPTDRVPMAAEYRLMAGTRELRPERPGPCKTSKTSCKCWWRRSQPSRRNSPPSGCRFRSP